MEILDLTLTTGSNVVNVGTHTSSPPTLMYSIPQGSDLGSVQFSLYINDLSLYVKAL